MPSVKDYELPFLNVARIMASQTPTGARVSNPAKRLMQQLAKEFICFVVSEAHDRARDDANVAQGHVKPTITTEHLRSSVAALGAFRGHSNPAIPPMTWLG